MNTKPRATKIKGYTKEEPYAADELAFLGSADRRLGLGPEPPTPSLGLMLSEGRAYLTLSPWTSVFSGVAILVASLGFNLLGDVLRDSLDPRLRGR